MKRLLAFIPLLVFCMLWAPSVLAEENILYLNEEGKEMICPVATVMTSETVNWQTGWYVVHGDVTIGATASTPQVIVNGDVHLILEDGSSLTVYGGIRVQDTNALSIYGQWAGTGSLTSEPGNIWGNYAGIGTNGADSFNAGTITICGGIVKATGTNGGAGIGSSWFTDGGTVTITGGIVSATGTDGGAGIGGGNGGGTGTVTITGGTVTALSQGSGAGIGGGYIGDGGSITITGGTVNATGTDGGAGIGGGIYGLVDTITITGGTVTASGGTHTGNNGGPVTDIGAAGIGAGTDVGFGTEENNNDIFISGGVVTATGGTNGAGIGGGYSSDGGAITISGGTVTANGTGNAAGIGGGFLSDNNGAKNSVVITGGTVTAVGGTGSGLGSYDDVGIGGAGIGSYYYGRGDTVTVTGGTLTAIGGENATAIGTAYQFGDPGTLTIAPDATAGVQKITVTAGPDKENSVMINNAPFTDKQEIIGLVNGQKWLHIEADYPITGVALDKTELSMIGGESIQLAASVIKETEEADQTVIWTTSDPYVAKVNEDGTVTAVCPGTATISAITQIGGRIANCIVKVTAALVPASTSTPIPAPVATTLPTATSAPTPTPLEMHTLHFNTMGGFPLEDMLFGLGSPVELWPYTPVREGYLFQGWYKDEALTQPVSTIVLVEDTTIYAAWTAAPATLVPSGSSDSGGKVSNSGSNSKPTDTPALTTTPEPEPTAISTPTVTATPEPISEVTPAVTPPPSEAGFPILPVAAGVVMLVAILGGVIWFRLH